MDRRISSRTRQQIHNASPGRATVSSVGRRTVQVEFDGLRDLIAVEPDDISSHWVGQRIDIEHQDQECRREKRAAEAMQWRALLGHLPKGTILEGRIASRTHNDVLIDFNLGKLCRVGVDHFMRQARHQFRDRRLPEIGEGVTMTYYGIEWNGTPILYGWDYRRDPRHGLYDSGYRSRYRGEDGPFAILPWDKHKTERF